MTRRTRRELAGRDIVVVGASAGGLQGVMELSRALPATLPAAVFVVIHTSPHSTGVVPHLMSRNGHMLAGYARDEQEIEHGNIYFAPPDRHVLLKRGYMRVVRGPQENGFRPAVDPLFRTAARAYGPRVIGVILSGALDDGTYGLSIVKRHGGIAVVQRPDEALIPSMPLSAVQNVEVDHVVSIAEMGPLLARLVRESVEEGAVIEEKPDIAEMATEEPVADRLSGAPSPFTCPSCGGSLWELTDDASMRFRCHVGHVFTADSLAHAQSNGLEGALWSALRALEEKAALRALERKAASIASGYEAQARDAEQRAALIREALVSDRPTDAGELKRRQRRAAAKPTQPEVARRKP
jgi:two-component system chemotaxis response regulator CheB